MQLELLRMVRARLAARKTRRIPGEGYQRPCQSLARNELDPTTARRRGAMDPCVLTLPAMLGQILLTLAVIAIAYLVLRSRRAPSPARKQPPTDRRHLSPQLAKILANGLLAFMLLGSLFYLVNQWQRGRQVVTVEVVNANTGQVSEFRAQRGDVEGRTFVTLDGQRIRLADVERMILHDTPPPNGPGRPGN